MPFATHQEPFDRLRTNGIFLKRTVLGQVVGFYSLVVGSVEPGEVPARVMKGLARHPVPVMILARLAVDRTHQGKGLGRALLKDALLRTFQAADIAGIRTVLVHAKDEAARQWCERCEFETSPTDPFHLYLMIAYFTQRPKLQQVLPDLRQPA